MNRFKTTLLAAACLAIAAVAPAHAGQVTYDGYSVLNGQNVTLNDAKLGINEGVGSGQITLNKTNTPGGMISTWCIDIAHTLLGSGTFTTGFLGGEFGSKVNALLTNVLPTLGAGYDNSAALQVAIWKAKYGNDLTVSAANTNITKLAGDWVTNVNNGTWKADLRMGVAVLSGDGKNQDQAYLTSVAVPEPASMAMMAAGLVGLGFVRRKRA